jgi:ABC-type lipopolysaccharide export system ATPase subunit
VVITDHNAEAILSMVDRLYVMEAGSILAAGTPQEIVDNREVRKAYLGESFVMPAPVLPNSAPVETADESPAAP